VEKRLADEPEATLASLEKKPGWSHFPSAILMPVVQYSKSHPANKRYGDAGLLRLAQRIGDMLIIKPGAVPATVLHTFGSGLHYKCTTQRLFAQ
jgi:hypothetical protein